MLNYSARQMEYQSPSFQAKRGAHSGSGMSHLMHNGVSTYCETGKLQNPKLSVLQCRAEYGARTAGRIHHAYGAGAVGHHEVHGVVGVHPTARVPCIFFQRSASRPAFHAKEQRPNGTHSLDFTH